MGNGHTGEKLYIADYQKGMFITGAAKKAFSSVARYKDRNNYEMTESRN